VFVFVFVLALLLEFGERQKVIAGINSCSICISSGGVPSGLNDNNRLSIVPQTASKRLEAVVFVEFVLHPVQPLTALSPLFNIVTDKLRREELSWTELLTRLLEMHTTERLSFKAARDLRPKFTKCVLALSKSVVPLPFAAPLSITRKCMACPKY